MIAERWSGGETSPLVISKVNHPSLWIDHYGLMRSEINGIERWHGIVPRKPGRNPSAYYGRTSKATSCADPRLGLCRRHGTRQFSSRNSALTTRSYGKNYKFARSAHERIIDSYTSITFTRGRRDWSISARENCDGAFFIGDYSILSNCEIRNSFRISSILLFFRYNV